MTNYRLIILVNFLIAVFSVLGLVWYLTKNSERDSSIKLPFIYAVLVSAIALSGLYIIYIIFVDSFVDGSINRVDKYMQTRMLSFFIILTAYSFSLFIAAYFMFRKNMPRVFVAYFLASVLSVIFTVIRLGNMISATTITVSDIVGILSGPLIVMSIMIYTYKKFLSKA